MLHPPPNFVHVIAQLPPSHCWLRLVLWLITAEILWVWFLPVPNVSRFFTSGSYKFLRYLLMSQYLQSNVNDAKKTDFSVNSAYNLVQGSADGKYVIIGLKY